MRLFVKIKLEINRFYNEILKVSRETFESVPPLGTCIFVAILCLL